MFAAKQSVELDLDMYLDTWESEMLDLIVTLELGTSPKTRSHRADVYCVCFT